MSTAPDVGALLKAAGTWELDPDKSSVAFRSSMLWGLGKVKGKFADLRGTGRIGGDGSVSGEFVIDAASVSTGNARRDTHLRSDDFFKTASHQDITYEASAIETLGADAAKVTGTLTIAGTTQPLELYVTVEEVDDSGVTVSARPEIDRSVWGVTWRKYGMTKMSTPVEVTARFRRADGGSDAAPAD
jgi:polyisoprenoid-binding protein YceI